MASVTNQSFATGNFTATGTWLTNDATSQQIAGTTVTASTTSFVDSAQFTPGAITVRGVCLNLSSRAGTTGTFTVTLRNATGGVDAATVTINMTDFPAETSQTATPAAAGSWHFFDFGSNVLLLAATAYTVRIKTSTAGQANLYAGASSDWNREVITSSAPANVTTAGVSFLIGQGYTGAGTSNTYPVTMQNNTATQFGNINVSNGGTLAWSVVAATNLVLAGILRCWGGSTVTQGTVGSPCVAGQASNLKFASGSDGQYGIEIYWNASVTHYGPNKTKRFTTLAANAAAAATSLTVADNLGSTWENGDVIALASTDGTLAHSETKALGAASSGTSIPTIAALTNAHLGTSPTIGHVANLTSECLITSTAANAATNGWYYFVSGNFVGTNTIYWAEFAYLGSGLVNKTGYYSLAVAGTTDVENNSFHDFTESGAIMFSDGATTPNYTFSNNVMYNVANGYNTQAATSSSWTVNNNLCITATTTGLNFQSVSGTITNNVAVSCVKGIIFIPTAGSPQTLGTISGNTAYSNTTGLTIGSGMPGAGTISTLTAWRNVTGLSYIPTTFINAAQAFYGTLTLSSLNLFGNTGAGMTFASVTGSPLILLNPTFDAGLTVTQPIGIQVNNASLVDNVIIRNGSFGATNKHSQADIKLLATCQVKFYLENTLLNSNTTVSSSASVLAFGTIVQADAHQQTPGNWSKWVPTGVLSQDTVIFPPTGGATTSVKMTPNTASIKLPSDRFTWPANNGKALTVSVQVRKGTSYNGNQQRLIVLRNDAMGITADTVLATAAASIGTWETLSGTTAAVSENGTLDFVVDCDGTAGTTNYGNIIITSN